MSTPRNHHFVSRVHINNFFNSDQSKIFVYDKKIDNFYYKRTTKSLFSERDLNTKFVEGIFDFESLEQDLNDFFEKDFPKNYETIKYFLNELKLTNKVKDSLLYFARYGIIGEVRNPRHKKNSEESIYSTLSELFDSCVPKLKKEFNQAFAYKQKTNYINALKYSEFASEMIKLMGNLIFVIETPNDINDYFLLPDFCAANRREQINTYFNPDVKEIAYIGLPISSKIYLHFYSEKIKNPKVQSGVYELGSPLVNKLNKINYDFAESKVACENENYLKNFVRNIARLRE